MFQRKYNRVFKREARFSLVCLFVLFFSLFSKYKKIKKKANKLSFLLIGH